MLKDHARSQARAGHPTPREVSAVGSCVGVGANLVEEECIAECGGAFIRTRINTHFRQGASVRQRQKTKMTGWSLVSS
ncbi:hypothetical protein PR048_025482 [Dryococelus australis]|uniref:Uncharacterized protein n=1 Tax=Dryococelus australis TaxID=614101 RepID=A0ABQ9GRG3_9NEOP|nr:hypothetical protein PR048_025482 [Dryococelus australis]